MTLSVIFLFIGISLASASSSYSEITELNLKTENKTIKEVLNDIESNSEFIFFYSDKTINLNQKVKVPFVKGNISEVLDKLLDARTVGYKVEDRQVVLYSINHSKESGKASVNTPSQAKKTIKGQVVDATGESLVGVSVLIKGTTTGTLTDVDGNFVISTSIGATLQFSYIGYSTELVKVSTTDLLKVVLKENVREIQEVVVTAPVGVQRQAKALGYAVSTVTAKQLTEAGNTNFASALYGKAAGVKITTAPGGASSAVNVQIRGINSLNYNQQPLYVVDGIMIRNDGQNGASGANNNNYWDDQRIRGNGALDINPDDIESLTVLKGASATALYGSDAASGVVVITTKKASKEKGLGVDLNYNLTAEQVAFLPKFQNVYGPGYDKGTNVSAGANAEGWIADSSSPSGHRPYFRSYGNFGPKMDGQQVKWWDGSIRSYSAQPNNYKDIYQNGLSSNLNLALSNQTEKLNYRISYTRLDYKGTQRGSDQARNTFNLNSTLKLAKTMSLDVVTSYTNTTTHNRPYQLGQVLGSYGGFFSRAEDMSLMVDKFQTSDGYKYVTYDHPERSSEAFVYNIRATQLLDFFWNQLRNKYDETENRLISSATLNWDIINHLKFRGRIGSDYTGASTENKEYNSFPVSFNEPDKSTGAYGVTKGVYSILYGDALLSYANKIGSKFNYTASLGYQGRSENYKDQSSSTNKGLITENWFALDNSYANLITTSKRQELLKYAYLGILNLSYHDYLFLEGTARQEYSSTLPPKNNHFFYPSVNGSFVLSEAVKLPKEISYAKIRVSYGIVGNSAPMYVSNIAYTQKALQTINGSVPSLVLPSSYGNENLKAETKYEREIGLETRFFEDRIGLDISFYSNKVKNQISDLTAAASTGATSQIVNIGEIGSKGLEMALHATPINGPIRWMTRFNISFNSSKVNSLASNVPQIIFYDSEQSALRIVAKPGEELGNIYAYPRAINDQGQYIINDDGLYVIDKTKYEKVGNIMPKAVGGFSNTLMYKNLALDFTIDYRIGGKMVSNPTKYMMGAGMFENTMQYRDTDHGGLTYTSGSATYHDGVLLEGVNQTTGQTNTKVIDAGTYYMNTFGWGADAWNEKGAVFNNSYIKLRELSLSYRVPASFCKKLCMNSVKVSLIGRNLFYLWKTLENIDPEAPLGNKWWSQGVDVGSTASSRSLGFSLNANF